MKRLRYSIHVIASTGEPKPVDAVSGHDKAIDQAEDRARLTGLETRVWDTQTGRCIYTVPAAEQEAA